MIWTGKKAKTDDYILIQWQKLLWILLCAKRYVKYFIYLYINIYKYYIYFIYIIYIIIYIYNFIFTINPVEAGNLLSPFYRRGIENPDNLGNVHSHMITTN